MEDTKEREEFYDDEEKMDDKEEQKWSGMIPISISMRPEEVCSIDHPEPYFVLVPRFARLTAFHGWFENGDIGRYFQQFRLMSDSSSSSSQASASASVLMNTAENTKSGGGGGGGGMMMMRAMRTARVMIPPLMLPRRRAGRRAARFTTRGSRRNRWTWTCTTRGED